MAVKGISSLIRNPHIDGTQGDREVAAVLDLLLIAPLPRAAVQGARGRQAVTSGQHNLISLPPTSRRHPLGTAFFFTYSRPGALGERAFSTFASTTSLPSFSASQNSGCSLRQW